jgi:hypothetical protein
MTEVLEKETEYLTPQDRAEAVLYGAAASKFSSNHDLTEYNRLADKYGVQAQTLVAEQPSMQTYIESVPAPAPAVEEQNQKPNLQPYHSPGDTLTIDMLPPRPRPQIRVPEPTEKIMEKTVAAETVIAEPEDVKEVEYVWKFKTQTLVAVTCVIVVLALLSTLLIINAVNIAKGNVELNQLENEYNMTFDEYQAAQEAAALAKEKALRQLQNNAGEYAALPVGALPTDYDEYKKPIDLESSSNVFDAICEFLSKIF